MSNAGRSGQRSSAAGRNRIVPTGPRNCGFVVFRRQHGRIEYLFLKTSLRGSWQLPPEVEANPGESDAEAALRVTKEKTGLGEADLKIYDEPKEEESCRCLEREMWIRMLAELIHIDKQLKLSLEYQDTNWLGLEDTSKEAVSLEFSLRNFDRYIKRNLI